MSILPPIEVILLIGFVIFVAFIFFIPILISEWFPLVIITHSLIMYNGEKSYHCSILHGLINYDVYKNNTTRKWVHLNSGRIVGSNHHKRIEDALKHYEYKHTPTTRDET